MNQKHTFSFTAIYEYDCVWQNSFLKFGSSLKNFEKVWKDEIHSIIRTIKLGEVLESHNVNNFVEDLPPPPTPGRYVHSWLYYSTCRQSQVCSKCANNIINNLFLSPATSLFDSWTEKKCKYPETSPDCIKPSVWVVAGWYTVMLLINRDLLHGFACEKFNIV